MGVFGVTTCIARRGQVEHGCYRTAGGRAARTNSLTGAQPPSSFPLKRHRKDPDGMNAIMDFLGQTWVMVSMGVALLALIGLMIFMRMKPRDED